MSQSRAAELSVESESLLDPYIGVGLNMAYQYSLDGVIVSNNGRRYCHSLRHVVRSPVELSFGETGREKLPPLLVRTGVCWCHMPPVFSVDIANQILDLIAH